MSTSFAVFTTVLRKELRDFVRDRRTFLMALLLGPLMYPLLMLGMGKLMEARMSTQLEKPLEIPIIGAEHAPNLVAWLATQDIRAKPAPKDLIAAIRNQDVDVALVIAPNFGEEWRASRPAKVEIVADTTRTNADVPIERLRSALNAYSSQAGALRLIARGVNPLLTQSVAVAQRDVATPEAKQGRMMSIILPLILVLFAFMGGANLTMDVTAGERERQSLEPLLATPAARAAIMSGKVLAASAFGLAMMALTLVAFKIGFGLLPSDKIGFKLELSTLALLKIFAVLLPMVLLGSAVLTALSATAKSYKEAQSYMTLLMLVPMLPSIILMVSPVKTQLWMLAVPFLSQNQLITKIARAETIDPLQWAVALAAAFAVALVVWFIAARMYHREQLAISA